MSILTGRRGAVDVRLLTPQTPPRVLTDPGLLGSADHAEQECLMRRAGIQARWEAGDLSIQQRAALLIDCEFDRANRLSRLESKGVRPPDTADNLIGTNTTDHGQENGMTDRQTGRIDRLTNRGYGFLSVPGTHGAMFFHARAVPTDGGHRFDDLAVGQDVTFILDRDERGRPCATDVRPVASASLPDWPAAQGAQMDDDGDSTTYDWEASA